MSDCCVGTKSRLLHEQDLHTDYLLTTGLEGIISVCMRAHELLKENLLREGYIGCTL